MDDQADIWAPIETCEESIGFKIISICIWIVVLISVIGSLQGILFFIKSHWFAWKVILCLVISVVVVSYF